jgi:hypothetical protein
MVDLPVFRQLGGNDTNGNCVVPEPIGDNRTMEEPITKRAGANARIAFLIKAPTSQGMHALHPNGCKLGLVERQDRRATSDKHSGLSWRLWHYGQRRVYNLQTLKTHMLFESPPLRHKILKALRVFPKCSVQ